MNRAIRHSGQDLHPLRMPNRLIAIFLLIFMFGCNSTRVSITARKPAGGAAEGETRKVEVTQFQGRDRKNWNRDANGTFLSDQRTVSFSGKCPRGVASVRVELAEGARVGGDAPCLANGGFDWSGTWNADYDGDIFLVSVSRSGEGLAGRTVVSLRIATVPAERSLIFAGFTGFSTSAPLSPTGGGERRLMGVSSGGTIPSDAVFTDNAGATRSLCTGIACASVVHSPRGP